MRRDSERDRATLLDIVSSAELIQRRMAGRSLDELSADIDLQDPIVFRLLVIGKRRNACPSK